MPQLDGPWDSQKHKEEAKTGKQKQKQSKRKEFSKELNTSSIYPPEMSFEESANTQKLYEMILSSRQDMRQLQAWQWGGGGDLLKEETKDQQEMF